MKGNRFITFDSLTDGQKETALRLGWYQDFVAFATRDEATKNYYQVSTPESGAGFSEQEIDAASKNLRNTEIYLQIKEASSNHE